MSMIFLLFLVFIGLSIKHIEGSWSTYNFQCFRKAPTVRSFLSMKGFGSSEPSSINAVKKNGFSFKQQKASLNLAETCKCDTGKNYNDCCYQLHDVTKDNWATADIPSIARARYSAFAIGNAQFVMATTHSTHRDYLRHNEGSLDPQKVVKSWTKEIVQQNSEIFEFLKFSVVGDVSYTLLNEPVDGQNPTFTLGDKATLKIRVIAREKRSSQFVPFEEMAEFVWDNVSDHVVELAGKKKINSKKSSKKQNVNVEVEQSSTGKWYYARGEVKPIDPEVLKEMCKDLPKYATTDTIRDKW